MFQSPVFDISGEREQLASIHLRIRAGQADQFIAEIIAGEDFDQWTIQMSDKDLEGINKEFQTAIEESIVNTEDWKKLSSKELQSRIRPLAQQGFNAYTWIFKEKRVRDRLEKLLAQHAGSKTPLTIQIASEKLFLPWELIYPFSVRPSVPVHWNKFWGLSFIIHRIIPPWNRPPSVINIGSNRRLKLGLLTDVSLPFVQNKEIPFFQKLNDNGQISLVKLKNLDPEKFKEGFTKFEGFWAKKLNIAHFACHATYEGAANKTKFTLTSDFPISLLDMNELKIAGNPLVIINACESGSLNPLYTKNFASYFIQREAMGVVTTECVIPDKFAAAFAQRLYTLLLTRKKRLGVSLLETRKHFLKSEGNPTGLVYSLYAPPSIRVSVAGGKNGPKAKKKSR